MRGVIVVSAILFAVLAAFSYLYVRPDKHSREPYDDHSADLLGDKAAKEKLGDGSSCLVLVGDLHEPQFRLARCLAERMRGWPESRSLAVHPTRTRGAFEEEVSRLRREGVRGLPIVLSETAPRFVAVVGCEGRSKHYLGDLADLIEVANLMNSSKGEISEEKLRRECD